MTASSIKMTNISVDSIGVCDGKRRKRKRNCRNGLQEKGCNSQLGMAEKFATFLLPPWFVQQF